MEFSEISHRITGISCPIFGISWQPTEDERTIARRIIIFLEPRRVLFANFDSEYACHCVESVLEIKNYLTDEIANIKEGSELEGYLRAMRNASNKFLSKCPVNKKNCGYCKHGTVESLFFMSALGEMRGVFGIMVGQICTAYGLDVEDELASIIPE